MDKNVEDQLAVFGMMMASRDDLVLTGRRAGVPVRRIAALMGIGHATVSRIVQREMRKSDGSHTNAEEIGA